MVLFSLSSIESASRSLASRLAIVWNRDKLKSQSTNFTQVSRFELLINNATDQSHAPWWPLPIFHRWIINDAIQVINLKIFVTLATNYGYHILSWYETQEIIYGNCRKTMKNTQLFEISPRTSGIGNVRSPIIFQPRSTKPFLA